MTATVLYLPGAAEPARSVVAPRRPRSFWRKPWWWPTSLRSRVRLLEKRLGFIVAALQDVAGPAPAASPALSLIPGGAA
jgi:hypothetical protein